MKKYCAILDKYFFWILLIIVIFIPLYPKFPLLNIPKTYVAIRLEDILIAAAFILWIFVKLPNLKKYFSQTIFQAIGLFWIIGAFSVLSGLLITFSVDTNLGLLHWLRRVEYMSLFLMAATSINNKRQIQILVVTLLLTALAVVIYGFGQIWLSFPVVSTTNKEFSKGLILYLSNDARVNSTFAGHYDLAVYLSVMLTFMTSLVFYYKKIIWKVLILGLGLISFALLGFTAARMSFAATLAGLTLVFWLNGKKMLVIALFVLALITLAAVPDLRHRLVATFTVNILQGGGEKYNPPEGQITVFTDLSKYPESSRAALLQKAIKDSTGAASPSGSMAVDTAPGEPVDTTELGVYRSWGIRLNVEWPRAINAFKKNPLIGTGYSSLTIATDNDYLRALGETGILGTLSLALIFFILIKRMIKSIRKSTGLEKYFIVASFSSLITLLASALFIDVLEASKVAEVFWLLMGISWAVMEKSET